MPRSTTLSPHNKYQYTYNNPLNMVDPDGHCPPCFGPSISGVTESIEVITNPSRALDKIQLKLSAIGMVPGAELADLANAGISALRGNKTEAVVDVLGAAGPLGSGVAVANRVSKIADAAGDTARAVSKADNAADAARAAPKVGSQGGPGAGKNFPKATKDAERAASNNSCRFCGVPTTRSAKPNPTRSNIDHAVPKSRGGNNTRANAQNTCQDCNLKKGKKTTKEFLQQ